MYIIGTIIMTVFINKPVYAATAKASPAAVAKAKEVVQSITYSGMSQSEMVIAVHDWICTNCTGNLTSVQTLQYIEYEHTADGPLLCGISVCEGYAETFRLFMNILGIKNRRVNGYVEGGQFYHAWNEVNIDGTWYAIDVTFDDPIVIGIDPGGVYSRKYCLISPEIMAIDHIPTVYF